MDDMKNDTCSEIKSTLANIDETCKQKLKVLEAEEQKN